ncbi:alkaline phosphatase D family protein [Acinetobacter towneri]|uniref:alkaline phosphatase D family protein n=1 Tax=Acinetobacter towneri TaxID=202956 RepID=UPI002936C8A5|nr:alkaline phosphatase D family protein [Acinetobacter towneri]MDV2483215.1 alkaline phosphatase D family protein [Acinetobacter towneri]
MNIRLTRRELIQKSLAGFGALSLPVALTACGDDNENTAENALKVQFLHGVASGDPLHDRIILWTRVTPSDMAACIEVVWEIASDEAFKQLVNTGKVQTSAAQDFTVKVDADRLQAGTKYYYRFRFGNTVSAIGQTKTLPQRSDQVKFAVCSCSNYPAGYFHVYKEMAQENNLDVIIHLGDYIYEYGQGGYATDDAKQLGRTFAADNDKEIIKLDDYRKRYALYRTDADLQTAHQRHPFIVIWDDHELSNDTWEAGADNHQEGEGSFIERKIAALQAYFEWMPIRPVAENDHLNIYRQFDFGGLVNLMMLDTRILARHKQLDYANYMTEAGIDAAKFQADLFSDQRTLMGVVQREWLQKQLGQSQATWNVLGQQVLMAKMLIPQELLLLLEQITNGDQRPETLAQMKKKITELLTLKMRLKENDPTLTPEEKQRLNAVAPYNLDAWDGYAYDREVVYEKLQQLGKKAVVLAGDTHNAWAATLHAHETNHEVGVEFATSSVSSPGIEYYLNVPAEEMAALEYAFKELIDELDYCNLNQRGYLTVTFNHDQVVADWKFVDTVKAREYKIDSTRSHQMTYDVHLKPIIDVAKTA